VNFSRSSPPMLGPPWDAADDDSRLTPYSTPTALDAFSSPASTLSLPVVPATPLRPSPPCNSAMQLIDYVPPSAAAAGPGYASGHILPPPQGRADIYRPVSNTATVPAHDPFTPATPGLDMYRGAFPLPTLKSELIWDRQSHPQSSFTPHEYDWFGRSKQSYYGIKDILKKIEIYN